MIIDQSNEGVLETLIVEGTVIFAENPINFDVKYFIVRKGNVIIGTESRPYTSDLTITLHGNYWDK